MTGNDEIGEIVEQWSRERPDLDTSGLEIVGRILVLAKYLKRRVEQVLRPLDLSLWGFDVLATLRRQGEPFRLTPTDLSRATMLTSGAMTNRLDRLETAGLVRRERALEDRRGVHVVLTPEGRELVDRAIALRLEEAGRAIAGLTPRERTVATELLKKLLMKMESEKDGAHALLDED